MKDRELKDRAVQIKNTWYDWLINYTAEPMRKIVDSFKDRVFSNQTHLKIMVKKRLLERKEITKTKNTKENSL